MGVLETMLKKAARVGGRDEGVARSAWAGAELLPVVVEAAEDTSHHDHHRCLDSSGASFPEPLLCEQKREPYEPYPAFRRQVPLLPTPPLPLGRTLAPACHCKETHSKHTGRRQI